jgi:hypothetical protein
MNTDLAKLDELAEGWGRFQPSVVIYCGIAIPCAYGFNADPLVGTRRFFRAFLDGYAGDKAAAIAARVSALQKAWTHNKCVFVEWDNVRKLLLAVAESDAELQAIVDARLSVFEHVLYERVRKALSDSTVRWESEAEEKEKMSAALLKAAGDLRAQKRTFDEAFAATPETGLFTERPPKARRLDESRSEPSASSDVDDSDDE